jgi:glycerate dehydrogenase
MKVVVLDAQTLGADIDLKPLDVLGKVTIYPLTAPSEVATRLKDADVVITNKVYLNEENLKDATSLRMIAITATGYNNVDLAYTRQKNIAVANVAGYSTQSVAQHTFALLFHLLEHLSFYDTYVKEKTYVKCETFNYIGRPFYEVHQKVWGIIGMGAIGKAVAGIATAFGAKVIYYSTSGANKDAGYPCVDLETLLRESDIVSIHAPLNGNTQGLINYKALSQMKKEAILINVGRGGIVVETDLACALNEDLIRGAALDVLEAEPIKADNPLYTVKYPEKWVVTPHIAWASIEARQLLLEEVIKNIQGYFNGNPRNLVQ